MRSDSTRDDWWRFAIRFFLTGPYSFAVVLMIVLVGALLGGTVRAVDGEPIGFAAAPVGAAGIWLWCKWFNRRITEAYEDELESKRRAARWPPRNAD